VATLMFGHDRVGTILSKLLRLAPFLCFALGVFAYVFFFSKVYVAPSRPLYSDPVSGYLSAACCGIAGLFFVSVQLLLAIKPRWLSVVGFLLNTVLIASIYLLPRILGLGVRLF
jgi:hypothetical protein